MLIATIAIADLPVAILIRVEILTQETIRLLGVFRIRGTMRHTAATVLRHLRVAAIQVVEAVFHAVRAAVLAEDKRNNKTRLVTELNRLGI